MRANNLIVVGLLAAMAVACLLSIRVKSPTRDEGAHIGRGIAAIKSGDFRLSVAHPPLGNMLSALPLLWVSELRVPFHHRSWKTANKIGFWREFFRINLDKAERLLFLSRVVTIILAMLLGFLVYGFAKELFGPVAGILAAGLFVTSPNIMAHSRLATTDLPITLGTFAAVYALVRFVKTPSRKGLIIVGVLLGVANLFKFSGVLLYPIHAVILMLCAVALPEFREKFEPESDPLRLPFGLSRSPLRAALSSLVVAGIISIITIWAGYGFEVKQVSNIMVKYAPQMRPLVNAFPIPLATYFEGLFFIRGSLAAGTSFFMGEVSGEGWWYYFPILFLLKTPIPLLILIPWALVYHYRSQRKSELIFILAPVAVFILAASALVRQNYGLRYILPVYPFLHVLVAGLWDQGLPQGMPRRMVWVVLLLWYAARTLQVHPDYLMYFNEFAGGPEGGYRYSVMGDDWGQDMKGLARYMETRGISEIYYTPFGAATPEFYGIEARPVPCEKVSGWVAVNITYLQIPRIPAQDHCYDWLKKSTPEAIIGHTIFVYHFPNGSPSKKEP